VNLLIVNYHYFREETYEAGIYPTSIYQLKHQLEEIGKSYSFIGQQTLIKLLNDEIKPTKNYCLLTFDDGLKEQMGAYQLLKQKGIPSVYFVPVLPYKSHQILDVHKIHFIRTKVTDVELYEKLDKSFKLSSYRFDKKQIENQYRYDDEVGRQVKYFLNFVLEKDQKSKFIETLFYKNIDNSQNFLNKTYMSVDDLTLLANDGCLGSHGLAHKPLATMTLPQATYDIEESIKYLGTATSTKIQSFSYPYGGHSAVNKELESVFEKTSIQYALTMWRGINTELDLTDNNRFFLKRVDTNDAPGGKFNSKEFVL
jgi:peptidoglycan/xylan/chitin deacetylase (PgdA/CDA1 family)